MTRETTDLDQWAALEADFTILGNPPSTQPRSCPAGPMSGQLPGQLIDERILESHFFPGLVFEFQDTDGRRALGRRDLPFLHDIYQLNAPAGDTAKEGASAEDLLEDDTKGPGRLTHADITGNGVLLCALCVASSEHDFRFYGWTGNDRNIAMEAADAIRNMQSGLPTRILLLHEDLFRPHGQADVTAALNAYTSGAFMSDRVERRDERFLWAVLTAKTRTFLLESSSLLGFEGPVEAPVSIIAVGELQRRLSTPWQAGYSRNSDAFTALRGDGDFDCVSFINTWETSPLSLDATRTNTDDHKE